MKSGFINISNGKRYKRKGKTRHHFVSCTYCDNKKFKLLKVHFKMYHPGVLEEFNEIFEKSLSTGKFGSINGIRFVKSN